MKRVVYGMGLAAGCLMGVIQAADQKQPAYAESMLGWKNPNIPLSPPPKMMGKQMGTVMTLGSTPMGYEMDGNVKVFTLIAQPVCQVLTDGTSLLEPLEKFQKKYPTDAPRIPLKKSAGLWGYNGASPGPTIEAYVGDRIRVVLKNELPEPTTIHWHGIELPNNQDGDGIATQYAVLPGESFTYEFTLYQEGTFMYHSGFNVLKQDGMGLGGMLIVHPKNPPKKIDRDFVFLLQEYTLPDGDCVMPNPFGMEANWFTMNGHVAPSVPPMTVNQGERVRIRIGNLSLLAHPMHLHGYSFQVVGTEGGPIPESAQWPAATYVIAPGETRDIEFIAWNPGVWRFHCHVLHHILNNGPAYMNKPIGILPVGGLFTYLNVIPKKPGAPWVYPPADQRE